MLKRFMIVAALLLALPAAANDVAVKSKYWSGTGWCEYSAFLITGYYNAQSMQLDVWSRAPDPSQPALRRTWVPLKDLQYPGSAIVHTPAGVAPAAHAPWPYFVLYQGLWNKIGKPAWIGESGDQHNFGLPPEALITVNPVAGEIISETSSGYYFDPVTGAVVANGGPWKYKTFGPGPNGGVWWWAQWPDQIRTVVEENPGLTGPAHKAFGYVFSAAQGGVMIDTWWTTQGINADGTFTGGNEWQIIRCGP